MRNLAACWFSLTPLPCSNNDPSYSDSTMTTKEPRLGFFAHAWLGLQGSPRIFCSHWQHNTVSAIAMSPSLWAGTGINTFFPLLAELASTAFSIHIAMPRVILMYEERIRCYSRLNTAVRYLSMLMTLSRSKRLQSLSELIHAIRFVLQSRGQLNGVEVKSPAFSETRPFLNTGYLQV